MKPRVMVGPRSLIIDPNLLAGTHRQLLRLVQKTLLLRSAGPSQLIRPRSEAATVALPVNPLQFLHPSRAFELRCPVVAFLCQAMDDYDVPQLISEPLVVFVAATSGQGEPIRSGGHLPRLHSCSRSSPATR